MPSIVEFVPGMRVVWNLEADSLSVKKYIKNFFIPDYGVEEMTVASVAQWRVGQLVTLERNGEVLRVKKSRPDDAPSDWQAEELLLNSYYLRPV
jgi:hypothetical protein